MRGLIFIGFGILYLLKPNIFRTGIWLKTPSVTNSWSTEKYQNYLKILAVFFIVLGIVLLIFDNQSFFVQESADKFKNIG